MPFSESTVEEAWKNAGGKCQCKRLTHDHSSVRCDKKLVWGNRGKVGEGAWEAHHISSSGGDGLSNCEILCWDCHSTTHSFGGNSLFMTFNK